MDQENSAYYPPKTTQVTYWRSAKVPTVQYGSRDICLTLTTQAIEGHEEAEYLRLKSFVDEKVEEQANSVANSLSDNDYRIKDGKKYPRVSKILSPDPLNIPHIEKYALRGTAIHMAVSHYLGTGEWVDPSSDISPLKWTDIKYKEFFEKFGANFGTGIVLNEEVFHEKHLYSGEIDFLGPYCKKYTLGDFKTGTWKLEQLVGYLKPNDAQIEQLAIFDLKKCEVHTWLIDEPPVQEAWENFLKLRGAFKQRFNI